MCTHLSFSALCYLIMLNTILYITDFQFCYILNRAIRNPVYNGAIKNDVLSRISYNDSRECVFSKILNDYKVLNGNGIFLMDSNIINQSYIAWLSYIIFMLTVFYVKRHGSLWNIFSPVPAFGLFQVFILDKKIFIWKIVFLVMFILLDFHMVYTESLPFTSAKLRYNKLNRAVNTVGLRPGCWFLILFQSHCTIFSVLMRKKQLLEPWAYDLINSPVAFFFLKESHAFGALQKWNFFGFCTPSSIHFQGVSD